MRSKCGRVCLRVLGAFLVLLSALGLCSACSDGDAVDDPRPKLVATTTILGDLARNLCGDKFLVTCLMGAGIDPHMYRASARDCIRLQEADVVLYNGINLEGKMQEVLKKTADSGKTVLSVEDALKSDLLIPVTKDGNVYDPHVWFDVGLWAEAAQYVADGLMRFDPANADYYAERAEEYIAELHALDYYVLTRAEELAPEKRVLVTAHDAFGYFGRAYGFEVYGIQGISTDSEAGTLDISRLADFISERKVNAVFIETSVSPKTLEALMSAVRARGHGIQPGEALYSDSLGDSSSDAFTYIAAVRHNIDAIINALGLDN